MRYVQSRVYYIYIYIYIYIFFLYSNLGKTCETVDSIRDVCIMISLSNIPWYICTCVNACVYVSTLYYMYVLGLK